MHGWIGQDKQTLYLKKKKQIKFERFSKGIRSTLPKFPLLSKDSFRIFRSPSSSKLNKRKKKYRFPPRWVVHARRATQTWYRATVRKGITRGKIEIFHGRTDLSMFSNSNSSVFAARRERSAPAQETRSLFARRYSPWKVNTPRSNSRAVAFAKFQSWKRRFQRLATRLSSRKVDTDSKKKKNRGEHDDALMTSRETRGGEREREKKHPSRIYAKGINFLASSIIFFFFFFLSR